MCALHEIAHLILAVTQEDKVLLPYRRWENQGTDDCRNLCKLASSRLRSESRHTHSRGCTLNLHTKLPQTEKSVAYMI